MLIISGGGGGAAMGSIDGYIFTTILLICNIMTAFPVRPDHIG